MFAFALRRRGQRGFYLLGLLLVLAIIFIVYGDRLFPDRNTGVSQYQDQVDRSKSAACSVNRDSAAAMIAMWVASHPGEEPTVEKLRQSGTSIPACPEGGVLSIGPDRRLYCSKHEPPPLPTQR